MNQTFLQKHLNATQSHAEKKTQPEAKLPNPEPSKRKDRELKTNANYKYCNTSSLLSDVAYVPFRFFHIHTHISLVFPTICALNDLEYQNMCLPINL